MAALLVAALLVHQRPGATTSRAVVGTGGWREWVPEAMRCCLLLALTGRDRFGAIPDVSLRGFAANPAANNGVTDGGCRTNGAAARARSFRHLLPLGLEPSVSDNPAITEYADNGLLE